MWSVVCLTAGTGASGQYYFYNDRYYSGNLQVELGPSAGMMNCLTDLGGRAGTGKRFTGDLNLRFSRPAAGLSATLMYRDRLGLQLAFTAGTVVAYDSILQPVASTTFGRYERNLSFRSRVAELRIAGEIHPLFFRYFDDDEAPFWSPYLLAGISLYHFNPMAALGEEWHSLRPLHTEGQGFAEYSGFRPYQLTQINLPLGIGVKYELSPRSYLRVELVHRILFTDYLDDVSRKDYVDPNLFSKYLDPEEAALALRLYQRDKSRSIGSQRGNPENRDSFFTVQLKLGMVLPAGRKR